MTRKKKGSKCWPPVSDRQLLGVQGAPSHNSPALKTLLLINPIQRSICVRKKMAACRAALGIHGPGGAAQQSSCDMGGTLFLLDLPFLQNGVSQIVSEPLKTYQNADSCIPPVMLDLGGGLRICKFISLML